MSLYLWLNLLEITLQKLDFYGEVYLLLYVTWEYFLILIMMSKYAYIHIYIRYLHIFIIYLRSIN